MIKLLLLAIIPLSVNAKTMTLDDIKRDAINESGVCLTAKPAKKKPAKKLYKTPPQTVAPVVEEENPCEIVKRIYHINEVVNNDYLGKIPRYAIDNVTRVDEPINWKFPQPYYWLGGHYPIEREVVKYVKEPALIATPLPAALWLFGSVVGLVFIGRKRVDK